MINQVQHDEFFQCVSFQMVLSDVSVGTGRILGGVELYKMDIILWCASFLSHCDDDDV